MSGLTIAEFDAYFEALHGHAAYPWQKRLAAQAVTGKWPGAIDLPTGSGKTACIDIAVFALACQASLPVEQRTAPRRIFFCVNRRVIVDEAYTRARSIAKTILEAEGNDTNGSEILCQVAAELRKIAGAKTTDNTPPLDVLELRGGIYRDNRWARSIAQPTIVCTTLDQLGSRLLFRGYGVSTNAAPIQAALIAYDSLILLDEAHISEPFRQTLDSVTRYLDRDKWVEQPIGIRPFIVVPMTATPPKDLPEDQLIKLKNDDRDPELPLLNRLKAPKPAELRETKKDVAQEVIDIVAKSLHGDKPLAVGIIVNRIATAKAIYEQLRALQRELSDKKRKVASDATIELVIGSMRPIDRDEQAKVLRPLVGPVGPDRPEITEQPSFVVATQCLEVGADYDFDVLITECASLDALRQRFGRLNRAGRSIEAGAYVLIDKKAVKSEEEIAKAEAAKESSKRHLDPIYGNALARTWNWLNEHADEATVDETPVKRLDFGIDAFDKRLKEHGENGRPPKELLAPSASLKAPVMMPAYVDFLCQTAPKPVPDPDVSLFIHGPQGGEPDVQVCWRADLVEDEDDAMTREHWPEVVALLPPTSAECISIPISRVRRWLADQQEKLTQDHGDTLGISETEEGDKKNKSNRPPSLQHNGVLWRGIKEPTPLTSPQDLRPGDTLVLPASAETSRVLGHLPDADKNDPPPTDEAGAERRAAAINDVAETAFTRARDRAAIRLHPSLLTRLPKGEAFDDLFAAAERDELPKRAEWSDMLKAAANAIQDDDDERKQALRHMAKHGFRLESYPDQRGVVLTGRTLLGTSTDWFVPSIDDGEDDSSRTQHKREILLDDHTKDVHDAVRDSLAHLPLDAFVDSYALAANLHDLGKADDRFQAMLRRADRTDAWLHTDTASALLAKSDALPQSPWQRQAARDRAGLPPGFRHEMLSVQLAEHSKQLSDDVEQRDLILHLIAAHHGHARPFAPVVCDDELPTVEVNGIDLPHDQRAQLIPAHQLDSGIAERFWLLTRRFGWWGLAYLEAVLRLADQQASAAEDAEKHNGQERASNDADQPAEATL
ncbi:MAG: type I-U CRISPR-associated helicase/endonuclease Cas3 [Phycisphaeraceae bacterium]